MKMDKIFAVIAGILGIIGLIVEVGFDLDNVYDMTTTALFVLVIIFGFLAAFVRSKPAAQSTASTAAKP